ncbi:MAG TPA: hypothetical protein VHJ00_07860 [Bradyrhizobium sp.]|nr:hypothetical protein [Bradyrhizobium sp.]
MVYSPEMRHLAGLPDKGSAHGIGEIGANRQPAKLTFLSQHCFARRPKLFESLFVPISEERAYPATVVQHMLLS